MVIIKHQLVASRAKTYDGENGKKFITIHETANTSKGADAQAHANLQSKGFSASWHWQVDDKEAIQSFPHNVRCWHGGDGRGDGNLNSIGIEICVNSDGDFKKAVENAAELVKVIMKQESIPVEAVVQHNKWSGKNCPTNLRNGSKGVNWSDFIGMVKADDVEQVSKPVAPQPSIKPATPAPTVKPSTVQNNSVVDYLNRQGKDSSFGARAKLAEQYGIRNYSGDADQNLQLLEKLQDGPPQRKLKEYVQLPKSAKTWRTYKLTVPPQKKYSDWSLTPSAFGGLEYEVLGKPFANVVTIKTSRGNRNIYVAPSTGAKIIRK